MVRAVMTAENLLSSAVTGQLAQNAPVSTERSTSERTGRLVRTLQGWLLRNNLPGRFRDLTSCAT